MINIPLLIAAMIFTGGLGYCLGFGAASAIVSKDQDDDLDHEMIERSPL